MFDVVHKYKGSNVLFATVKSDGDHHINLSAYGIPASNLLEKYLEGQRDDNEEQFEEWDKALAEAVSKSGSSSTLEVEDGYVYITTFQNGIGITPEDKAKPGKDEIREARLGVRIPVFQSDDNDFDGDDADDDYDG